jgi:hypothetical protein
MEEMLREFPPRTMFDYIETAKANTEILVLFRKESPEGDDMEAITCGLTQLGLSARFTKTETC